MSIWVKRINHTAMLRTVLKWWHCRHNFVYNILTRKISPFYLKQKPFEHGKLSAAVSELVSQTPAPTTQSAGPPPDTSVSLIFCKCLFSQQQQEERKQDSCFSINQNRQKLLGTLGTFRRSKTSNLGRWQNIKMIKWNNVCENISTVTKLKLLLY